MNTKNTEYLFKKYPKIFAQRKLSIKESAMPWGFECGDGWFWLIDNLCSTIQNYIDANDIPQIEATQVKEKYGSARFYFKGGDDLVEGMVWLAEELSYHICEQCGSTKNVTQTKGWIVTLCENCMKRYKAKQRKMQFKSFFWILKFRIKKLILKMKVKLSKRKETSNG